LRAAALHDEELASAMERRNERRRKGVAELLRRLGNRIRPIVPRDELVNVLYVLLSFETFDAFAGARRTPEDVAPVVSQVIRGILALADETPRRD
jgi:hypothetical protein